MGTELGRRMIVATALALAASLTLASIPLPPLMVVPREVAAQAADTIQPTGTISINPGSDATSSTTVTLALTCSDNSSGGSGCSEVKISVDGVFDTEVFEAITPTKTATLQAGDGIKFARAIFKDAAGNVSVEAVDSIVLDTVAPATPAIVTTPAGSGIVTTSGTPTINGTVAANFVLKFGSLGTGNGQFNGTAGIAIDPSNSNNVYVADRANHRIQKFDSSGNFVAKWGSFGTGDGEFSFPGSVAIDTAGNVYVVDDENHRVQKFDSSGTFLSKWGSLGSGDGQFHFPRGIASDSSNNVYVVDKLNHRIQKFDSTGAFITKWGSSGSGDGQFAFPTGIAVDTAGNVYVADEENHRIQKFDSSGTFLSKWGTFGTGNGQFAFPTGITVDSAGNVYVAERANNRIQRFDSSGNFITKWGSFGTGDGQFYNSPSDVAVDAAGNIYAADSGSSRVQKFDADLNNATLEIYDGTTLIGSQSIPPSSEWSFTPSSPLGTGFHNIMARVIDAAGNISTMSATTPTTIYSVLNLSNSLTNSTFPNIAVSSSSGTVHVVWEELTGVHGDIFYKRSSDGGRSFGSATNISNDPDNSRLPYVATDDGNSNNVHVIWQSFNSTSSVQEILYRRSTDGGLTFGPAQVLSNTGTNAYNPHVAVSGNNVHAIWGAQLEAAAGKFYNNTAIAVDSLGNAVYVADRGNHRVQKFDTSGNFIAKWGTFGSGTGQFDSPEGIAVDSVSNIYVADTHNHRVQKFDSNGEFLAQWGSLGTADGQFDSPKGIAIDPAGDVYVVDSGNHRIQKFDPSGNFITKWGSFGTGDGEFSFPEGIGISMAGVFVTDNGNSHVQKFDPSGTFITKWGSSGSADGQFAGAIGIAVVDTDVYVVDSANHRIQKFDKDGNYVAQWGSYGTGDGQLNFPQGIAADASNNVYVSDTGSSRIQKFDSSGNFLTKWGSFGTIGKDEIFYSKSTDGGATFSPPVNISNSDNDYSIVPYLAVSSSGGSDVHAVWQEIPPASGPSEIAYSRSTDGGATFSPPVNISANAGNSANPHIVVSSGNTVHIIWDDDTAAGNSEILYKVSTDGGASFGAATDVSNSVENSFIPYLAATPLGRVLAVWSQEESLSYLPLDVMLAKKEDAGNPSAPFGTAFNISSNAGDSDVPESAILGDDLLVVWHDSTTGNMEINYALLANMVNAPPAAHIQSVATNKDTAITITLTGDDADGDALAFSAQNLPVHGTLGPITPSGNSSATVTYTPNANFGGVDSFTFKVNDGIFNSTAATVSLTVISNNVAPVASAGPDQTVNEGALVTLNAGGSSDPDNSSSGHLTFSWIQLLGPPVTLSNSTAPSPTFTAPDILSNTLLRFQVTVSDGSLTSTDTVDVNELDRKGELTIKKVLENTDGTPLQGAVFRITPNPFTLTGSLTVQDKDAYDAEPAINGTIRLRNVEFTTYTIEEITTPSGFARIVQNTIVNVHSTQQAPVAVIENRPAGAPVVQPVGIPSPDLSSVQFNNFVLKGASVNGVPVTTVNDLPSASLVPSTQLASSSLPPALSFSQLAPPSYTAQQLLSTFTIPTYPAPEQELAANNVYVIPPIVIGQQGSANNNNNKFLVTPVLERTIAGATYVMDQTTPTASGSAQVRRVEMTFANAGAVANAAFSFSITDTAPPATPAPPPSLVESPVMFVTVSFVGDFATVTAAGGEGGTITDHNNNDDNNSDFSSESAFQTSPKIRVQISKGVDIVKLADGCPDVSLFFFNESVGQWTAVKKPARDSSLDAAQLCGYVLETDHWSKFAVGGVKIVTNAIQSIVPLIRSDGGSSSSSNGGGGGTPIDLTPTTTTTTLPDSYFVANPLAKVQPQSTAFVNTKGQNIFQAKPGEQISIASTFKNFQQKAQDYAVIVQVIDSNGFTVDIDWVTGSLAAGDTTAASRSWVAEEPGTYTVKMFVWDGVGKSPTPLSEVTVRSLVVA